MKRTIDDFRELGTITSVEKSDRDCCPSWIQIEYLGGGSTQGFGGYLLKTEKHRLEWETELCHVFGVHNVRQLVGEQCYALFDSPGRIGRTIRGLHSVRTNRKFLVNKFFSARGYEIRSVVETKTADIKRDIELHKHKIEQLKAALKTVKDDSWEW